MTELTFRMAVAADVPALAEVFGREPSDEQLTTAGGDRERGRKFRALAGRSLFSKTGLDRTLVAVRDGEVVGMLQTGAEAGDRITLALAWGVLRIFGARGVRGFLARNRLRDRVHVRPPAGTYHIAELHVSSRSRNLGIGAALLAEGERRARLEGFTEMSLTTTTSNPARHLYERAGFDVARETSDPEYLRLTGISGHLLMVKQLV